jgi:hypothetical protein
VAVAKAAADKPVGDLASINSNFARSNPALVDTATEFVSEDLDRAVLALPYVCADALWALIDELEIVSRTVD